MLESVTCALHVQNALYTGKYQEAFLQHICKALSVKMVIVSVALWGQQISLKAKFSIEFKCV